MKGFLSKDIHNMGEAHNDSGIELAKALCEQTNWPMKPVRMFSLKFVILLCFISMLILFLFHVDSIFSAFCVCNI